MANYKKKQQINVALNDDQKSIVRAVIANMILTPGTSWMRSRVKEMGRYAIKPEMLPQREMDFERDVLRVLYSIENENSKDITATESTVASRLVLEYGDEEATRARLRDFLRNNRTDERDVSGGTFAIADWVQYQRQHLAALQIVQRQQLPVGDALEAYREGLAIWNSVAPGEKSVTTVADEFMANHRKLMDKRKAELRSGGAVGPTFPWAGLRQKINVLKEGDVCTFLAKKGHGKSTLVLRIAEFMAWKCVGSDGRERLVDEGKGYDVLILDCENDSEDMQDRWVACKLRVQSGALAVPEVFDHEKEPYKSRYDALQAEWEYNNTHRGKITHEKTVGLTKDQLITQVGMHKAEAEARGRKIVVIIDYFQAMDFSDLNSFSTVDAINKGARKIKEVATSEDTKCFLILFAQFGMDTDYGDQKAGYYGQAVNQISQDVIRVERQDAKEDLPMIDTKTGMQIKDLIGVPVFLHLAGQPDARAWLNIIQSNRHASGPVAVRFVGAYYDVTDDKTRNAADYALEKEERRGGKRKSDA